MDEQYGCHEDIFSEIERGCSSKRLNYFTQFLLKKYDRKIRKTAYTYRTLEFEYAYACCRTGMYHAMQKYEYRKGIHFIHFATGYMRSECQKEYRNERAIHIPHQLLHMWEKLQRLGTLNRSPDTYSDWEKNALVETADIISVLRTTAIDAPTNDGEMGIGDITPQETFKSVLQILHDIELAKSVQSFVAELRPIERETIIHIFGLHNKEELGLREIAPLVNRSHAGVANARDRALKHLKESLLDRESKLTEFLRGE